LRELWDLSEQQRLIGAGRFISALASKGPLREGLGQDTATEVMWVHMSPDNYLSLVVKRGWSAAAYRRWLEHTLTAAPLPPLDGRRAAQVHARGRKAKTHGASTKRA
jgi:hypothetical protein